MQSRDFCYCTGDNNFVIRLITKKNDIDCVNYVYKDKYPNKPHNSYVKLPMKKVASDSLLDYYEVHYKNDFLATRYCFELIDSDEVCYYSNYHYYNSIPDNDDLLFTMPKTMHQIDALTNIEWMNSGVVYQIFPDRFNRGSKVDGSQLPKWDKKPMWQDIFGGTINGIREKLDHIQELGANIIYLTPIFESPSPHKYDTKDYLKIDPGFGNEEDFRALVDDIHSRGMKIILDCVVDHCGYEFPMFKDLMKNQEKSQYANWFHVSHFPIRTKNYHSHDIEGFSYFVGMPKLNVDNNEVREYFSKMVHHWMENFDVDGWRLDVADEVAHSFWNFFNREVKSIKPDAPIIGEVWYDTSDWLDGNEFDSTMNYPFFYAVNGLVAKGDKKPSDFMSDIGFIRGNTNVNAYNMLWNLIDSHDSARFLHCCSEDKRKFKLAVLLQMTLSGTPMIYYGDEVGMTGGGDPDCRRGMIWDEQRQDSDLLNYYKKLIHLRRSSPSLYMGDMYTVIADDDNMALIFTKEFNDEKYYIAINCSDKDLNYDVLKGKIDVLENKICDGMLPCWSGIICTSSFNNTNM